MTTFIATPAAELAAALGITPDPRVRIEVTRTDWDSKWCEETGAPAAVTVTWVTAEDGENTVTDRTITGGIAGDYINTLLMSDLTDRFETVWVQIAHQYVRFVHPGLADIARSVNSPIRIAA